MKFDMIPSKDIHPEAFGFVLLVLPFVVIFGCAIIQGMRDDWKLTLFTLAMIGSVTLGIILIKC